MPPQARVTSVDALSAFRAHLVNYLAQARATVEEITGEMVRTRVWLQQEQRLHWEGQARRRSARLNEARQALHNVKVAHLRDSARAEEMAMRSAKSALEEAESKLALVKRWHRDFDSRVEPSARPMQRLHTVISKTLPEAIAFLDQTIRTLEAYREIAPPRSGTPAEDDSPRIHKPSGSATD
jgi:hypothetical protein